MLRADHDIVSSLDELSDRESNGVLLHDLLDDGLGPPPSFDSGGKAPSRCWPGHRPHSREQEQGHISRRGLWDV